ncbi:hypothetical protein COV93_01920 [Candidatus Woesearchaeota archaeon CG11_big_fil_rev_8_21_14_0_20_43_8]|nr:MAG: hypothetical protein COV93_01920 [Candidatus Woesearchaeota archaeon CG11_big_fil_rev_8_21_14_0_20_43_8]PIO05687.1 MAG: hypothetical protein COT47_03725 [Candidatus Woesearchaeota archaeon CG08_land_8_20_14_0_20_43_7]
MKLRGSDKRILSLYKRSRDLLLFVDAFFPAATKEKPYVSLEQKMEIVPGNALSLLIVDVGKMYVEYASLEGVLKEIKCDPYASLRSYGYEFSLQENISGRTFTLAAEPDRVEFVLSSKGIFDEGIAFQYSRLCGLLDRLELKDAVDKYLKLCGHLPTNIMNKRNIPGLFDHRKRWWQIWR